MSYRVAKLPTQTASGSLLQSPSHPSQCSSQSSSSYSSSSSDNYDALPMEDREAQAYERSCSCCRRSGRRKSESSTRGCGIVVAIPLISIACLVVLIAEFYVNGLDRDPNDQSQDCYYRLELGKSLFCAASFQRNMMIGPANQVLLRMGAKENDAILNRGEGWRLVTPIFLHAGVFHYLPNILVLLQIGWLLEATHGTFRVTILFMLTGIFGVIMSAILSPYSPSVGASGAIFGLLGGSLAAVIQNWPLYNRPWLALCQLACSAAFSLVLGTMPMVDNIAHFFGFSIGFLAGLGLLTLPIDSRRRSCSRGTLQVLGMIAAYLAFIAGLMALYGGWDAYALCPECGKISCIPFPWGCDTDEPKACWWDCSLCSHTPLSAQIHWVGTTHNGTVTIRCPVLSGSEADFRNYSIWPLDVTSLDSSSLVGLCKHHCPDMTAHRSGRSSTPNPFEDTSMITTTGNLLGPAG